MTERVSTGGTKVFEYKKGSQTKLNNEQKREIGEAYDKYYERKRKDKRKRNIAIMIVILIILTIIIAAIMVNS